MKTIYIIIALLVAGTATAQQRTIREADELFADREYAFAAPLYEKLASYKGGEIYTYKLAECYRLMRDYRKALVYYNQLRGNESLPLEYFLNYGTMLHYAGSYDSALVYYNTYLKMGGKDPNATTFIRSCEYAKKHAGDSEKFIVKPSSLSIGGLFTGAGMSKNNEFVTGKPNTETDPTTQSTYPNYRFIATDMSDEGLGSVSNVTTSEETRFYLGTPVFNNDYSEVYYTRSSSNSEFLRKGKFEKEQVSSAGVNTLAIYKAVVINNNWMYEERMPFNNREFSNTHPTLSMDGKKMIFASNRPGGKGGYDLYIVKMTDSTWSEPINLGDKVNTANDEMFPYLDHDTLLYFASNGHVGFGGADIYSVRWSNNNWQAPQNMGTGINTSKDDFGLIWKDKRNGYFASDRAGKKGVDDIYAFSVPVKFVAGTGEIFDKLSGDKLPNARIRIYADSVLVKELTSDAKGNWKFDFFDPDMYYKIAADKPGYESSFVMLDPVKDKPSGLDIGLNPSTAAGDIFTFNNILFEYDKAELLPESQVILDRLAEYLISNRAKVELSAHTDSRGRDAYNLDLSRRRAASAVTYLIMKGVDAAQLVSAGYGESLLKNKCNDKIKCDESEHAINRRVEVKVLDVKR